jgi:26S proteasome regulatory subunit N10
MAKEDIIVCVDNSEFMRNGDLQPSRMESQVDAINYYCGLKSRANIENRIGLLSMAGKK